MIKKLAKILPLIALIPVVASADFMFKQRHDSLPPAVEGEGVAVDSTNCKTILESNGSTGNGVYSLSSGIDAYCDMTTDGGGWTMVTAQFEADPVTSWGEGIQADYDPTLASGKSFTFLSTEIPAHTQTAFGQHLNPTAMNYFDFVYTKGDIDPKILVTGKKDGLNYQISRGASFHFNYHNPEEMVYTTAEWTKTLTVDKVGGRFFSWAFAPKHYDQYRRGYGLNGSVWATYESYAWTIWVR